MDSHTEGFTDDMIIDGNDYHTAGQDDFIQFTPVISAMNLEGLPQLALSIRQRQALLDNRIPLADTDTKDPPLTCVVLSPPLAGSYNILFPLQFSDGLRWLCKVPSTGYYGKYDDRAADALKSEVMTMRLIKGGTSIPVPEVYTFDANLDNEINCPFIMMEHLQGRPLYKLWFQQGSSKGALTQLRTRVRRDLAAATVQLNSFRYPQGGSLLFDQYGNVNGIGSIGVFDLKAQADRLTNDGFDD